MLTVEAVEGIEYANEINVDNDKRMEYTNKFPR